KLDGARGFPVEIRRATAKCLVKVAHQIATGRHTHHITGLRITGLRSGHREGFSWHLQRLHRHDFYAQATIDDGVIERFLRRGAEPQTVKRHVGSALRQTEWKPSTHQLADQRVELVAMQRKHDGMSKHWAVASLILLHTFHKIMKHRITGVRTIKMPLWLDAGRRHRQ